MSKKAAIFQLKEDSSEVEVYKNDVEEVTPDADFRFSLISLVSGEKYFVTGTESEVWEKLESAAEPDGIDLNIIL